MVEPGLSLDLKYRFLAFLNRRNDFMKRFNIFGRWPLRRDGSGDAHARHLTLEISACTPVAEGH